MEKKFFIYFQILNLALVTCYIKIPLKFHPCQIFFNTSYPSNAFSSMVMQQLYAKLEIGTPKQTILVPLELESNEFYISKYNSHLSNEKYKAFNLKNFQEESSLSFRYSNYDEEIIYYGTNFLRASISKDLFFFGDKKAELEFYLADTLNEETPGELGLQIKPLNELDTAFDSEDKFFLKKLRNSGLIKNYIWTIIYNNNHDDNDKNDVDAYLFIGDYLHNINSNELNLKYTFKQESLSSLNAYIYSKVVTPMFEMDKLIFYKDDPSNNIIEENTNHNKDLLNVKLDFNLNGIQASEVIRPYLELNIFTEENKCHKGDFYYQNKFFFYYCDKDLSSINKIKKDFPTILFMYQDFNFNFTITIDDIIVEKDGYFYFLIFFGDYHKYVWRLGKPFLNKYNFMIDQDENKIFFYSEKEEVVLPGFQKKYLVVLLIILIIIFLLLGFLIGRKLYKTKIKKHMNILDDNFDYTIQSSKSEIEMSKKI